MTDLKLNIDGKEFWMPYKEYKIHEAYNNYNKFKFVFILRNGMAAYEEIKPAFKESYPDDYNLLWGKTH